MANQTKNLFVGCGGAAMINASHMLGARYGLERIMGRDRTPVRAVFDYAESHFLQGVPVVYLLTVTTAPGGDVRIHGLFAGRERARFEEAVRLSQEKNVFYVGRPSSARWSGWIRTSSSPRGWATRPSTARAWRWPTAASC